MKNQHDQQHHATSFSTPPTSYPPAAESYNGPYVMAPPPMGYPTKDTNQQDHVPVPNDTTTRGGGFLKGCLAGLCCCWCVDCCF